jgi:hypothetical protein
MAYKAASTADQTARSGQRRSKNFGSGPGRGLAAARRRDLAPPHSKSLPSQRLFVLLQVYDLVLPSQGVLVGLGLLVAGLIAFQGDLGCHSWPRAPDWALQGWSCAAGLVLCIADPAVVGREREAGRERALGQATKLPQNVIGLPHRDVLMTYSYRDGDPSCMYPRAFLVFVRGWGSGFDGKFLLLLEQKQHLQRFG